MLICWVWVVVVDFDLNVRFTCFDYWLFVLVILCFDLLLFEFWLVCLFDVCLVWFGLIVIPI